MKRLVFTIFLALCATAPAQTIRTLGYNSTNGQIVTATNVVWTNAFSFSTNAVAAQVRTNLGLGASDDVVFDDVQAISFLVRDELNSGIFFEGNSAAVTRTNLGVSLAALTNDSNLTMMRALSGSTNTNHPFSGSISVVGTNNTNTLVFSNGILQSVQ